MYISIYTRRYPIMVTPKEVEKQNVFFGATSCSYSFQALSHDPLHLRNVVRTAAPPTRHDRKLSACNDERPRTAQVRMWVQK